MKTEIEMLADDQIYNKVLREEIPSARKFVLVATALAKQTTVEVEKGEFVPFFELIDKLVSRKVNVALIFAGKPSKPFIESLKLTTCAGLGRKSSNKRNFEHGIFTRDPQIIKRLWEDIQQIWEGKYCQDC